MLNKWTEINVLDRSSSKTLLELVSQLQEVVINACLQNAISKKSPLITIR